MHEFLILTPHLIMLMLTPEMYIELKYFTQSDFSVLCFFYFMIFDKEFLQTKYQNNKTARLAVCGRIKYHNHLAHLKYWDKDQVENSD